MLWTKTWRLDYEEYQRNYCLRPQIQHAKYLKRQKTSVIKSWLILVLHLIGLEVGENADYFQTLIDSNFVEATRFQQKLLPKVIFVFSLEVHTIPAKQFRRVLTGKDKTLQQILS